MAKTSPPCRQSTTKADKQIYQENPHQRQERHKSHVFPPHLSSQSRTPHSKVPSTPAQSIRFVNQQIYPFTPLQHSLNILAHNIPHIVNLMLRIPNRVLLARIRRAIANHDRLESSIKRRTPVTREVRKVRRVRRVLLEKNFFLISTRYPNGMRLPSDSRATHRNVRAPAERPSASNSEGAQEI